MALQVLELYPDKVILVYHHYPFIDSKVSWEIAESLEFAGDQDKFWEMHDQVTLNTPGDRSELIAAADDVGLNTDELIEALNSGQYYEIVKAAREEAQNRGVRDIALFINDTEYMKYPGTLDDLINAIDTELQRLETNDEI